MQLERFCEIFPQVHRLPDFDSKKETEWHGVQGLWYEGAEYRGKKTKVYACMGYPTIKEGEKVPAVVLVHGGGGHAYAEWVKQWNNRGFAAIAMDTTGYFPSENWKGLVGMEEPGDQDAEKYTRQLYGSLLDDNYTVGPDNSGMKDFDLPLEEQWMYHAVASTILAHNILRNDSCVDTEKIGICGISWGGIITSIAIGYDNRYAFAIPIYGSGYLDYEPSPKLPKIFSEPAVRICWSAAERFEGVAFPVLWRCWTADVCFSIGANSKSYLATKATNSYLSISFDMNHSHYHGWTCLESYRFAKCILEKSLPFVQVVEEPEGFGAIDFQIAIPEDFTDISATIFYLTEPMEYDDDNRMTREWKSVEADIGSEYVRGIVPKNAWCYFVEMKGYADGICYVTNSSLKEG